MREVSTPGLKAPSMPCSSSNMCFFPSRWTCSRSLAASCSRQGNAYLSDSGKIDKQATTGRRILLHTGRHLTATQPKQLPPATSQELWLTCQAEVIAPSVYFMCQTCV